MVLKCTPDEIGTLCDRVLAIFRVLLVQREHRGLLMACDADYIANECQRVCLAVVAMYDPAHIQAAQLERHSSEYAQGTAHGRRRTRLS